MNKALVENSGDSKNTQKKKKTINCPGSSLVDKRKEAGGVWEKARQIEQNSAEKLSDPFLWIYD